MVSTLESPAFEKAVQTAKILDMIPKLFDKIGGSNRYQQEFYGDSAFTDARRFAEGMRKQCGEFVTIEQRNSRVVMTIND